VVARSRLSLRPSLILKKSLAQPVREDVLAGFQRKKRLLRVQGNQAGNMPAQTLISDQRSLRDKIVGSLPFNSSSQQLVRDPTAAVGHGETVYCTPQHVLHQRSSASGNSPSPNFITRRQWCTVFIVD